MCPKEYLTVFTANGTSNNRRFDNKCVPKNIWLLLHLMTLQVIEDLTINVSQKYLTVVTFNGTSSNRRFDSKCVPKILDCCYI